jgi:NADPH2:quinone reductase
MEPQMKAILFDGAGSADVLRLVDAPMPVPRPHDLLVRVHAAGINRADILQRQGLYGDRPDYGDSLLPGLEIAGEVVEAGPDAEGFQNGDRVMAIVGGGAYAEYARVDSRMAMPIPPHLTYVQAAAIPEVFVTAHEAVFHLGGLQAGDWALIHAAAGGVGSAAIQLVKAAGAHSVFTASGEMRIARVQEIGGTVGVDYKQQDFLDAALEATHGRGVAVVVDFIGAPYLEPNLRALAEGGRLVQVGALGGTKATLPIDLVIHRCLRIVGTVMKSRSFAEKAAMTERFRSRRLAAFAAGELRPLVDHVFPLEQAAEAHRSMEAGGNFGKIILAIS